jgi:hypothetical protein
MDISEQVRRDAVSSHDDVGDHSFRFELRTAPLGSRLTYQAHMARFQSEISGCTDHDSRGQNTAMVNYSGDSSSWMPSPFTVTSQMTKPMQSALPVPIYVTSLVSPEGPIDATMEAAAADELIVPFGREVSMWIEGSPPLGAESIPFSCHSFFCRSAL